MREVVPFREKEVAICMPSIGNVDPRVIQSVAVAANRAGLEGYPCSFGITQRTLVHTARNWLAEAFINDSGAEWSFWVDDDMILPNDALVRLLSYARSIPAKFLSGVYYQRHGSHKPVVWRRDPEVIIDGKKIKREYQDKYTHHHVVPPKAGPPVIVHSVGFGCALVHRDVFLAMTPPYFKFVDLPEGKEVSEDFYFNVRARDMGVEIWLVPEVKCGHIGTPPVITESDFQPEQKDLQIIDVSKKSIA